jgi:hypothetical protein
MMSNIKLTCYSHPDRVAVAKIQRKIVKASNQGVETINIFSPICQDCEDDARRMGIPVFELHGEGDE